MPRQLTRRDFINGVALAGTALHLSPMEAVAQHLLPVSALGPEYYPPALTGLRGSVPGTFELAHAVAREGHRFSIPEEQTESTYDLVVVGGGISGLSAAHFFRDRHGSASRILILDNHDDFGGHARRNELRVNNQTLLGYGGSQAIDTPSAYSKVAAQLLVDIGIHVERFYNYFDQDFFNQRNMRRGIYFDASTFQRRALTGNPIQSWSSLSEREVRDMVSDMPISQADQDLFCGLLCGAVNYLADYPLSERETILRNTSYLEFLRRYANQPEAVRRILRDSWLSMVGAGWEAVSAWEATEYGFPGTGHLGVHPEHGIEQPYIFKFPDGNASIARSLVRQLIPGAIPGRTMEDLVTAKADYSRLDQNGQRVKIRLNSTVVHASNTPDGRFADVVYVREGNLHRVRANHVVMACYNQMVPHICPEVPASQRDAINTATKIPYVIGTLAVTNWAAFQEAGYYMFYSPGDVFFKYMHLDYPVSIGDYRYAQTTDQPIVLTTWYSPNEPGLPAQEQFRAGREKLLQISYDDFEQNLFTHLDGMLGPHGFDVARDVAGVTFNRWSHGYAYEFEGVGINPDFGRYNGPHIAGRARIGRISIANSDSEAHAYADGAIDAADRAVNEQLGLI